MKEIKNMTIEELEARSAEIVAEVTNPETTEERLKELEGISIEIEERKNELKKAAAEAKEVREAVAEDKVVAEEVKDVIKEERKMTNKEVCATKEYRDAFANYIRTGDDKECRALLTENVSGDVPVASIVYDIVKNAWEKEGIVARIKKAYVKGNLRVGFEISADGAFIHTEGQSVSSASAENLVLGTVNIVASNIKKFIYVSDEVIDSTDFLNYVYDELVYQIAKKLADQVIAKIEACGTVSTNTPSMNVAVPKITEASIALNTIANAIAQLSDQAADPVIIMNKATFASFKAVQAAGSYGYDPFEGLPVLFNSTITAYSAATTGIPYMIVGDLDEGALMNFPAGEGIDFKFDEMTLKKQDLIEVLGRQYVAIGVVAPNAFVKVTK